MLTDEERARFESYFTKGDRCWTWTGGKGKDGYGRFHLRRLTRAAHRVAWFSVHGPIPKGMVVNHTCRNKSCVNPQHLNLLTPTENVLKDSASRTYINSQKTHCPRGHPYDRQYAGRRYCSICTSEKKRRLRQKWAMEDTVGA